MRLLLIAGARSPATSRSSTPAAERPGDPALHDRKSRPGLTRPDDPVDLPGTTADGRAGTEIRTHGRRRGVAQGAEGNCRCGASVFPGYLHDPEANAEAFTHDRWFRTGDLAAVDEHGNIVLKGRIKDTVNRGGVKYSTREVEDLLLGHPAVDQAAVVPAPHPRLGEIGCAFAVTRDDRAVTLDDLCAYLLGQGIAK